MSIIKYNGTDTKSTLMIFFAHNIVLKMINDNEDHESTFIKYCKQIEDWPKWKDEYEA